MNHKKIFILLLLLILILLSGIALSSKIAKDEEIDKLEKICEVNPDDPNCVLKPEDILKAREVVRDVYMDEKIEQYIVDIVNATRTPEDYNLADYKNLINFGASPRASISLALASKAYAFINRRGFVIPEDVRAVCPDVLRHRIGLTYEAEAEDITQADLVNKIMDFMQILVKIRQINQ